MTKRDYYEVLGVARTAGDDELKKAYRKLAFENHPDRNQNDPQAAERFKEAAEAYQVLSDAEKRAAYDRFGHEGPQRGGFHPGFTDVEDIFSTFGDLFGDFFGFGGRRHASRRGADLETEVTLSFDEAVRGAKKTVRVRRHARCASCGGSGAAPGSKPETCTTCNGRGQVGHSQGFFVISTTCPTCRGQRTIVKKPCAECRGQGVVMREEGIEVTVPAGVDDGQVLRVAGKGQASPDGGQAGHLYVVLRVASDPRFERDGAHLHARVTLSVVQASLGAEVTVPTLGGDRKVKVEPGTQPGHVAVLRGEGIPRVEGGGRGDLHLHFEVVVPTRLNARQRELLRELGESGLEEPRRARR
jgi:molecular chaperone DnaJ